LSIIFVRYPFLRQVVFVKNGGKIMYIDPGSGSVLLQLVLATLLGAGVLIRVFWKKITSPFRKKNTNDPEND
jgi:hypothetical protein